MRTVIPLLLPMFLAGCTATILPTEPCETNEQCQAAFGYGSACNLETTLCDTVELHPRCDAFTAASGEKIEFPLSQDENFLISTLFGRNDAHTARYHAVELAIRQVNDDTALDGKLFNALHCSYEEDAGVDDLSSAEAVVEVGTWLADQVGVPVNIGPAASSLSQDLYGAASVDHGMLVISPSATSDALTGIDGAASTAESPGLFWRTAPPDGIQGIAIATDMLDEFDPAGVTHFRRAPSTHVAIVYETGAYGEGLATIVAEELTRRAAESTLYPFDGEAARSQALADIVVANDADEILLVSANSEDYSAFLVGAAGNGWYDDKSFFVSDGGRTVEMLTEAAAGSSLFPNIRGSVAKTPGGVVFDSFDASFRGTYSIGGNAHAYTAHSYDAAWAALYGFAWAVGREGSVRGENIAKGLRHLSNGPSTNVQPTSWTTVQGAMASGNDVDILGTSGPLDWDPNTAEIAGQIEIFVVNAAGDDFNEDYTFTP